MKMFEKKYISKKDNFIVKVMFGVPFACFVGFMIYSFLNKGAVMETKKQNDLNRVFNGRVESLYRDRRNHNVKTAILSDGFKYVIPYSWEEFFNVGDSLSKKRNSLKLEVYKVGQNKKILDYEITYKKD